MVEQNEKNADIRDENPGRLRKTPNSAFTKKGEGSKQNLMPKTIVISGSARLPEGAASKHLFGRVVIELEVSLADKTIVDISCTSVPVLVEKILRNVLLENKIDEGIEEAIAQLDKRFFSVTKKAIIAGPSFR